jgi:hypothetical protein
LEAKKRLALRRRGWPWRSSEDRERDFGDALRSERLSIQMKKKRRTRGSGESAPGDGFKDRGIFAVKRIEVRLMDSREEIKRLRERCAIGDLKKVMRRAGLRKGDHTRACGGDALIRFPREREEATDIRD